MKPPVVETRPMSPDDETPPTKIVQFPLPFPDGPVCDCCGVPQPKARKKKKKKE